MFLKQRRALTGVLFFGMIHRAVPTAARIIQPTVVAQLLTEILPAD